MARPREKFTEKELIELGKEMVEWVKANNPLHLNEWYSIEKNIIYNDWKSIIQKKEFIPYYELALSIVSKNYLSKNSDVSDSIKHRWQRIYFRDVKEEEDNKVRMEVELKSKQLAGDLMTLDELKKKLKLND